MWDQALHLSLLCDSLSPFSCLWNASKGRHQAEDGLQEGRGGSFLQPTASKGKDREGGKTKINKRKGMGGKKEERAWRWCARVGGHVRWWGWPCCSEGTAGVQEGHIFERWQITNEKHNNRKTLKETYLGNKLSGYELKDLIQKAQGAGAKGAEDLARKTQKENAKRSIMQNKVM